MSNTVPFIYNFCDRWCERCYFTRNCSLNQRLTDVTDEEMDMNNKAFWERLSSEFSKTLEMLRESGKEWGVDIDAFTEEELEEAKQEEERKWRIIKKNPITAVCREYGTKANALLSDEKYWKAKAERLVNDVHMGVIEEAKASERAESISECQEVIGWYMFQIEVKMARALSGKLEDDEPGIQSDANGSAKVALLGVERSMHALNFLLQLLQDEDRFLPLLSLLNKIDRMVKKEFPNAPLFIRPGFDEQ